MASPELPTDRCAKKVTLFAEILLEIQDQKRCGRNLHCAAVSRVEIQRQGGTIPPEAPSRACLAKVCPQ